MQTLRVSIRSSGLHSHEKLSWTFWGCSGFRGPGDLRLAFSSLRGSAVPVGFQPLLSYGLDWIELDDSKLKAGETVSTPERFGAKSRVSDTYEEHKGRSRHFSKSFSTPSIKWSSGLGVGRRPPWRAGVFPATKRASTSSCRRCADLRRSYPGSGSCSSASTQRRRSSTASSGRSRPLWTRTR